MIMTDYEKIDLQIKLLNARNVAAATSATLGMYRIAAFNTKNISNAEAECILNDFIETQAKVEDIDDIPDTIDDVLEELMEMEGVSNA